MVETISWGLFLAIASPLWAMVYMIDRLEMKDIKKEDEQ